ncbi:MAG: glycoside hydrolase family 99-like domain-containing protein [Leadbetterella sp.]
MSSKKLRALAVVLPQFHPIPENDSWWGKGFTEWTNVVKARPRFSGHYQPHLPADLGFYDLRLPQSRQQQADLAKGHDIFGFCFYHYWFNGKQLLDTPLRGILESGKPDFPFMLCWANENWSRRWDGLDKEVLMEQNYSLEDHRAHAKWLCENVFKDSRYIKVNNKPFFLFYNSHIIPELKETIAVWRDEVKKHGFEDIYLAGVTTGEKLIEEPIELGFDALVEWQPDWVNLHTAPSLWTRLKTKLKINNSYRRISYDEVVRRMKTKKEPSYKNYKCIMPSWDNCARRKTNAFLISDSTPDKYKDWLEDVCEKSNVYSNEENFVFLNAWNEWAEGNHLEPDQKWGKQYLQKTKEVLQNYK